MSQWELEFDYDEFNSPNDIYSSSSHHSFSTANSFTGDTSLHVPWREGQNHMGSSWCMLDNFNLQGLNQHGQSHQLRQFVSFYIDPNWTESAGGRFLASSFRVGSGDSGGGNTDGTNGHSVRHEMQNGSNGTWNMSSYAYNVEGPTYTTISDALHHGWNHIETYVQMNTWSGSSMNQDGIVRIWIDDQLELEQTNHAWTYQDDNLIERCFVNTWVVSSASPDQDYHHYYDRHAIDTTGDNPTQPYGAPDGEPFEPEPPDIPTDLEHIDETFDHHNLGGNYTGDTAAFDTGSN